MKGTSMVKRTKEAKLNALIGKVALSIAKEKNDPLFTKYDRAHKVFLKLKKAIIEKYKSKATQVARQMLTQSQSQSK